MKEMKDKENTNNNFLTAKEVSNRLGIPLSTLYRLSKHGRIKSMHIGGRWYYPEAEVERYLSCDPNLIHFPIRQKELPERRSYPRINCLIECSYSIDLPQKSEIYNGIIKNISGGGLLLVDKDNINNISMEDPVRLKFRLKLNGDPGVTVDTKGRIVRKTIDGFGAKFRNINKEYKDLIIRFVG